MRTLPTTPRPPAAALRHALLVAALTFLPGGIVLADDATAGFRNCLKGIRADASAKGLSAASFDKLTAGVQPDLSVLELLDHQPEFRTPIWDYLSGLVDDERVSEGRLQLMQWRTTLAEVEARFGVDPETVVAVWGVESNFGQTFGKRPLLTSLVTLSCFGRRQDFFRGEFITALRIVDEGHIAPEAFVGSWAGAFGHTQFMPSTFMRIAIDFDGDGRRDLMNSIPDALASTANYLKQAGWRSNEPWGFEVSLPAGMDVTGAGRRNKRASAEWARLGVRKVDGGPLPEGLPSAGLLLPAGAQGPTFLVMRNFDAIYSYNAAESYGLAIAHLADRLRGQGAFKTPWPTDDPGLSRAERREVQTLLIQRGFEIGTVDGIIGSATRTAIETIQREAGLPPDGRAGGRVLAWLRDTAPGN